MHLRESFYEATVQVIPILLLVLAVGEIRWKGGSSLSDFFVPLAFVALMVLAEFFALGVLAGGSDSPLVALIVITGLAAGFTHIALEFAALLLKDASGDEPGSKRYQIFDYAAFAIISLSVIGGGAFLFLQYD